MEEEPESPIVRKRIIPAFTMTTALCGIYRVLSASGWPMVKVQSARRSKALSGFADSPSYGHGKTLTEKHNAPTQKARTYLDYVCIKLLQGRIDQLI
jgi:hypothetical protein